MSTAAEYLANAEFLEEQSRLAHSVTDRAMLFELAQQWRQQAATLLFQESDQSNAA